MDAPTGYGHEHGSGHAAEGSRDEGGRVAYADALWGDDGSRVNLDHAKHGDGPNPVYVAEPHSNTSAILDSGTISSSESVIEPRSPSKAPLSISPRW